LDTSHAALILGLSKTAIGVARCLGRAGVRVRAIDDRPGIARFSRFVDAAVCPNPITDRRRFVDYLSKLTDADWKPNVIYITDDRYVEALADKPAAIDRFLTDLPPESVSRTILDKAKQLEAAEALGIPIPTTVEITAEHDIDEASARIGFPMLLKGGMSNQWKSIYRGAAQKGFVVSTGDELADRARYCIRLGAAVLAQQVVPGPETSLVGLVAYVSAEGEPLCWFTRRKLRQHPPRFGSGSLVESTADGETAEVSLRLLAGLGWRGIASAEFKRDESDGTLRLIEVNPRYPLINALGPASGVNLALVQYLHLTGQPLPPLPPARSGVKWIDIGGNLASGSDYRARMNLRDWLKDFRGPRVYAECAWDDPLPLFGEIADAPKRMLARRRRAPRSKVL
jgi:D-aspartate ligase